MGEIPVPNALSHMPRDAAGFAKMLDFGFKHFITLGVIKVLYILGLVMIVLGWVAMTISGFIGGILTGLLALILGAVFVLVQAIFLRVWLELIVVIFRIGENTTKLVELRGGSPSAGGL